MRPFVFPAPRAAASTPQHAPRMPLFSPSMALFSPSEPLFPASMPLFSPSLPRKAAAFPLSAACVPLPVPCMPLKVPCMPVRAAPVPLDAPPVPRRVAASPLSAPRVPLFSPSLPLECGSDATFSGITVARSGTRGALCAERPTSSGIGIVSAGAHPVRRGNGLRPAGAGVHPHHSPRAPLSVGEVAVASSAVLLERIHAPRSRRAHRRLPSSHRPCHAAGIRSHLVARASHLRDRRPSQAALRGGVDLDELPDVTACPNATWAARP